MVEVQEKHNRKSEQFPEIVPVLPLNGMVVFPLMLTPMSVNDPRELQAIDAAVAADRYLLLVALKEGEETPGPDTLHEIGSIAAIHKMMQLPDETRHLVLRSYARVRIVEFVETAPVLMARIEPVEETGEDSPETRALFHTVLKSFERLVELSPYLPKEAYVQALNVHSASSLADLVASALPIRGDEQQRLLATLDVTERLRMVHRMAQEALTTLEIADRVGSTAREEIEKNQREYVLREQLKAIQRELGQETEGEELEDLRTRLQEANLPEEARKAADREVARLERMNPAAAEYSVVRTYLEWMAELPWSKSSEEIIDVEAAQRVLDEDHYDLEEVKDRIIEYLAVRKIKQDMKGPILCFVGPPGVGKTSLGKSIARATGREFVRMSLGGVRDEAEIRGHRRTYVGALPGRIIRAVRDAGTNNPVIMLDEVDKLGADFRGDPSSALLEVLDPAQNSTFSDHYLEVPFDLSQVMFICTANVLQTIPAPLLDRMEVIQLAGYTEEEKVHIAKRYLVPRQREEHGLTAKQLRITDAALRGIIGKYTRESGVRNLERQIGTVCRKIARRVAAGETELPTVTSDNLESFLGRQKIFPEACDRVTVPGVVTGLAWTQTGGEILFIEATRMPGKKGFKLTGQLGDVMQESADAALSYVRSNAEKLGIEPDFFDSSDIHIHVPSGAVPKDGPSAGVAMVTALVSLLTGKRVKCNVGMTGEITLRGKVLPIGGVKEKSLAARRAGLDTVILPLQNQGDVRELSEELRGDLKFIFAETIGDVLSAALEG
ncbi:MAG: endopeptidase La [Armatimonadetes bacterium]|nr:endopeptidase La [Armatimonadota bacterium]